ncbi:unnamed protein product [Closterium sp. NIES-65]|nr:unnamed protein product [Closterium sp. NIES-65]
MEGGRKGRGDGRRENGAGDGRRENGAGLWKAGEWGGVMESGKNGAGMGRGDGKRENGGGDGRRENEGIPSPSPRSIPFSQGSSLLPDSTPFSQIPSLLPDSIPFSQIHPLLPDSIPSPRFHPLLPHSIPFSPIPSLLPDSIPFSQILNPKSPFPSPAGPAVPVPAPPAPPPLVSRARHPTCSSRAAHLQQPSSSAAEPSGTRAALPPSRPGAEPPAPEPPDTRAALPPSRPGAEPPDTRAALPPSRPAAESLSRRAALLQSCPACPACQGPLSRSLPTTLTVDVLEKALLAAEKSIVAVGASRGDPRTPILRGALLPPLLPSVASAAAADLLGLESVGAAFAPSGDAALARARGARALVELEEEAVEVAVEAAEGVGVAAGVVEGVVVVVVAAAEEAAVVAAAVVVAAVVAVTVGEAAAEEAVVAEEVELVEAVPSSGAAVVVVSARSSSSSSVRVTSLCPSSSPHPHLTPLGRPIAVSLADPSGGPVLSHFSTVLPCPAAPSGTLSGLYLPSFSTNLVSGADLQDAGVHQFTPASQRVTHCTDARTGRHLATFSRRPGSSLYTLTTTSPPVPASGQVAASGQVLAAASGSGPSGVPYVEGRLRAAPHSSQFPPTEAPLQTLHMEVWGPAPVSGQGHERYFLWWQFYHPSSRRVLSSQDVTFDESVPFYRLFPYRTPSLPPPPDFLVRFPPGRPPPLSGVSQVDAVDPVEVTGDFGAAGVLSQGVLTLGGCCARGVPGLEVLSLGVLGLGPARDSLLLRLDGEPLSPQELREWFARAGGVLLELVLLRPSRVLVLPVPELRSGLRVLLELELLRVLWC